MADVTESREFLDPPSGAVLRKPSTIWDRLAAFVTDQMFPGISHQFDPNTISGESLGGPLRGTIFAPKAVAQQYRQIRKQFPPGVSQVSTHPGQLPSHTDVVENYIKALFRGPLWHGTSAQEAIRAQGFRDPPTRRAHRFGEPSGVSLSGAWNRASEFGGGPLRVGVKFGPQDVLPVMQQSVARRPLLVAYRQALKHPVDPETGSQSFMDVFDDRIRRAAAAQGRYPISSHQLEGAAWNSLVGGHGPKFAESFNKALSRELQEAGIKGLAFSPRRYGEYELLALNPKDVFPLEQRFGSPEGLPSYLTPNVAPRYLGPRMNLLGRYHEAIPQANEEWVRSLSDIYRTFTLRDLLNP